MNLLESLSRHVIRVNPRIKYTFYSTSYELNVGIYKCKIKLMTRHDRNVEIFIFSIFFAFLFFSMVLLLLSSLVFLQSRAIEIPN